MNIRFFPYLLGFALSSFIFAADAPQTIGDFGPTGLEVYAQKDLSLKVASVMPGSPAEGKLSKGQLITAINGQKLPSDLMEQRRFLAGLISQAEASDGKLTLSTKDGAVDIQLEVLGAYSPTWPVDCAKTDKVIRAHADHLSRLAGEGDLGKHHMLDALGILALLSTGEDQDLEVVRSIYQTKMKGYKPGEVGSHTWNNGYSGIAVCEYYLRTGDKSVMPYINEICEAARKWQVNGGWTHWAKGVNPQYVGGGLLNAAGTNMLTTLLLAKQCGAEVDEQTLQDALRFFYRFVGHGANAYGDHRPEFGYGGNNGKTEQIAFAMQIATHSDQPGVYAKARDRAAISTLYAYPYMLNGHTGAIGNIWYGLSTGLMLEKTPELYRNWFDQTHWYFELSRRHDGSFEMSGTGRYDQESYGRASVLGLTAPRKALQINGAPKSEFSVPFSLPKMPWGKPADLAFLDIEGGSAYRPLSPIPHIEFEKIGTATGDTLKSMASHPEPVFRERVAAMLRKEENIGLIEPLLKSEDPYARHTACMAINQFEAWRMRYSKDWRSGKSIDPAHFTDAMLESLLAMVRDPEESLWLKDQAMLALVQTSPEKILANVEIILPWLEQNDEWWLYESAMIALLPALQTEEGCELLLPKIGDMLARNPHTKSIGTFHFLLQRNRDKIPESQRALLSETLKNTYADTPDLEWQEGDMDLSGITSLHLTQHLATLMSIDPSMAPVMAKLSARRLDDLRARERGEHIDSLISAARKLEKDQAKEVGKTLTKHYRSTIFEENAEVLSPGYDGWVKSYIRPLNKILAIDELAGKPSWELLDNKAENKQEWLVTSYAPPEKLDLKQKNRSRPVTLPAPLENWYKPDFEPVGWKSHRFTVGDTAPTSYRDKPAWKFTQPHEAGEVLFMRKTFELEDVDYELFRLVAFTRQGFEIYINGEKVVEEKGRSKTWNPRISYADKNNKIRESLRPGTNVLTAKSFLQYFRGKEGDIEVYLEGLREMPKPE